VWYDALAHENIKEIAMPPRSRIVIALFLALTIQGATAAQAPNDAIQGKIEKMSVDWSQKRVAFEMRGKPWSSVFEWFSDQTEMPFCSTFPPPTGTFTFINPKDPKTGKPREYPLTDVFDFINEILMAQHKFMLLRSDTALTMFPADEPIPAKLIPRVELSSLKQHARTEFVEVELQLRDDVVWRPGRNGFAVPMTPLGDGRYLVRSDVGSLRRLLETLPPQSEEPTSPAAAPPVSQSPPAAACCRSTPRCRAGLVARLLRR
jgi:hypothetical protein